MIKKIIIFVSFILFAGTFAQQTHTVQKGDNSYSIARKYGMTMDELVKLNPGIKEKTLAIGEVVKIKAKKADKAKPASEDKPKTTHSEKLGKIVLQPKQTIYGITKQYHVSEAELRKLNPNLDSGMKIGDEVILPLDSIKKYGSQPIVAPAVAEKEVPAETEKPVAEANSIAEDTYTIQPKDNYYRITKKFGLTQQQLFDLNPGLENKGLKPGDILKIKGTPENSTPVDKASEPEKTPENKVVEPVKKALPEEYTMYTVQDNDTVFGILNKFGMSLDELMNLNPQLSDGLKSGMILKVKNTETDTPYIKKTDGALKVVLLLPFGFDVGESKYRTMSVEFLTGAKLAIERNTGIGQKLDIKVIDTENEIAFKNNLSEIDKNNTDLIVGPLFKSNIVELLKYLGSKKIPVIAPFANSEDLFDYSNLIMVQTQDKTLAERIAKEVSQVYSDQKIYIVADEDKEIANTIKSNLEKSLKNPNVILVNSPKDIQADKNMMTGQSAPVIAILANEDNELGNKFADRIIELTKETQGMKAFSMYYNTAFEKKTDELSQANLVYLMDRKINSEGEFEKEIIADYKEKYCKSPSKYAVIGFDILNDALSRENSKGEIFNQISKSQTQLATKFEYVKTKNNGAYINTGYRVVRLLPQ